MEITYKDIHDFNEKDFHEFFLSVGPTYYEIIRERMIMWIDEQ